MARAVTPAMQELGKGAIVNISSGSGFSGTGSSIAYAASKAALNVMTYSLARALAPEIRVNAVCPGVMQTRWWRDGLGDGYEAFIERYAESAPLKSAGTTQTVADPVVWLLEGAEHVTGENHPGGRGIAPGAVAATVASGRIIRTAGRPGKRSAISPRTPIRTQGPHRPCSLPRLPLLLSASCSLR